MHSGAVTLQGHSRGTSGHQGTFWGRGIHWQFPLQAAADPSQTRSGSKDSNFLPWRRPRIGLPAGEAGAPGSSRSTSVPLIVLLPPGVASSTGGQWVGHSRTCIQKKKPASLESLFRSKISFAGSPLGKLIGQNWVVWLPNWNVAEMVLDIRLQQCGCWEVRHQYLRPYGPGRGQSREVFLSMETRRHPMSTQKRSEVQGGQLSQRSDPWLKVWTAWFGEHSTELKTPGQWDWQQEVRA